MDNGTEIQHQGKESPKVTSVLLMVLMLTIVLLMLFALAIFSAPIGSDKGSAIILNILPIDIGVEEEGSDKRGEQWTEVLSWEPRAFILHNFLSKEECKYIINLARPHMAKSTAIDSTTGNIVQNRIRTSSAMFLRRSHDKVISDIENRIADLTFVPVEHGEGLQVLHYEEGQTYRPHFDFFFDEYNTRNGGQLVATFIMYLSDVEEGGETVFPDAKGNFSSSPGWNEMSKCAKKGLAVKPKMGDALLFWSVRPDATFDRSSLHGGCPVIRGNKWASTKWIRAGEYKI